mgnify:FL=1
MFLSTFHFFTSGTHQLLQKLFKLCQNGPLVYTRHIPPHYQHVQPMLVIGTRQSFKQLNLRPLPEEQNVIVGLQ